MLLPGITDALLGGFYGLRVWSGSTAYFRFDRGCTASFRRHWELEQQLGYHLCQYLFALPLACLTCCLFSSPCHRCSLCLLYASKLDSPVGEEHQGHQRACFIDI
jgi:hypothetical protein